MVEWRLVGMAIWHDSCWRREGGGISYGIPPSHAASPEWLWRIIVGPSGTLVLMEEAQQARGRVPPALI